MSFHTLDHLRAKAANEALSRLVINPRSQQCLKRHRTVLRGAALYVRQVGLLQALAFWLSKKGEECNVANQLMYWLETGPDHTRSICSARSAQSAQGSQPAVAARDAVQGVNYAVVAPLLQRTSTEIAILEADAAALLDWLSRLTEGLHQSLPKSPPGETPTPDETRSQDE